MKLTQMYFSKCHRYRNKEEEEIPALSATLVHLSMPRLKTNRAAKKTGRKSSKTGNQRDLSSARSSRKSTRSRLVYIIEGCQPNYKRWPKSSGEKRWKALNKNDEDNEKEERYLVGLQFTEEAWQARIKSRNQIHGKVMRDAVFSVRHTRKKVPKEGGKVSPAKKKKESGIKAKPRRRLKRDRESRKKEE